MIYSKFILGIGFVTLLVACKKEAHDMIDHPKPVAVVLVNTKPKVSDANKITRSKKINNKPRVEYYTNPKRLKCMTYPINYNASNNRSSRDRFRYTEAGAAISINVGLTGNVYDCLIKRGNNEYHKAGDMGWIYNLLDNLSSESTMEDKMDGVEQVLMKMFGLNNVEPADSSSYAENSQGVAIPQDGDAL